MTRSLFPVLSRSAIGFDNLFREIDKMDRHKTNFPPYNIIKHSDGSDEIVMALAGFSKDDVEITLADQSLTVTGKAAQKQLPEGSEIVHQGMAMRDFTQCFQLGNDVIVSSAKLTDGVLSVILEREVKEDPVKKIDIL